LTKSITSELRVIWIAPDGFKFFSKQDAELHCEEFNLLKEQGEINEES
tara:strand:- start:835 stop:978 length:144 start_codon:yes stop_codon:yes gene_type:complete